MEQKTNKEEQVHERGAENVCKSKAVLRCTANSVKNPSSLFKLFFEDKILCNILQYTNKNMQPVIDKFSDPLDG